jgi:DNA-binding Xre family transcriptional regulator
VAQRWDRDTLAVICQYLKIEIKDLLIIVETEPADLDD